MTLPHSAHQIALPRGRVLSLGARPTLMGILNLTPDSFSDGGQHEGVDAGLVHAAAMVAAGTDILDIGGESTRPGATLVPVQDELDRVVPALLALRASGMTLPISIDTYKPLVAHQALEAGADIINDVHGLQRAPEMAEVAALFGAPVIVMHWDEKRDPARDIISAMLAFFEQSLRIAEAAGLERDKLILDPGFGFGKTLDENYAILRRLGELHVLGLPVLAGTSRKSMIGRLLDKPTDQRLSGTLATSVIAYGAGAHIFRVHDVAANHDALRVAHATAYGLEGA